MSALMDPNIERTIPTNSEAERSVLGGILLEAKAYDEAAARGLTTSDFSVDSHRRIYLAIQQMGEAGSPIDLVTVCNFLGDRRELDPLGGAAYLASLLEGVPDRPSIGHYVDPPSSIAQLVHELFRSS